MGDVSLLLLIFSGFVGAILGSFLNALLFRFGTGRSALRGRSRCMHCSHELSAVDLVPFLSFLYLRGRCRYCSARLSRQYPAVELAGAAIGVAVYAAHPEPLAFVFWLVVFLTLLFVVVYDLKHGIIPWSASGLLAALGILSLFISPEETFAMPSAAAVLAGPLLALPLLLISLVSGGRWMGWGDGTLELGLGWLLGLSLGFSALLIAFWSGAAVGIVLLILSKRFTMRSEIPFAPFLVAGAAAVHFLHVDILSLLQVF